MAAFSPYLDIASQHMLLNSPVPLILPRRDLNTHFDENDFQSNRLDAGRLSSNVATSLSGLGIRNLDFSKTSEPKSYSQDIPPAHLSLDRNYNLHTPTIESTYDTLNETLDSFMKPLDTPSSIPSTWSFSSVIKAAEISANEALHELRSSLSLELGLVDLGNGSIFLDTEDQIPWAFEKLPVIPKTFVSDFMSQLSASDLTAVQMPVGGSQTQTTYNFPEECPITSAATNLVPELSLPVVDIAMRNVNFKNPCIGVNPADILPASSPPSLPLHFSYLSDALSTNQSMADSDFLRQKIVTTIEHLEFQSKVNQISRDIVLSASAYTDSKASKHPSDDEHSVFHSPASSEYSPSLKSPVVKQTFSIKGNKRRIARTKIEECDFICPEIHDAQDLDLPINLGTPVLDAHRGVDLEELKAKAERYRLRNQGRDYDKRWLISFAGKLSTRGELVEEFRCYITGCQQTNKRRDHILIHVGAHLDQRPFKCRHWYVF